MTIQDMKRKIENEVERIKSNDGLNEQDVEDLQRIKNMKKINSRQNQ